MRHRLDPPRERLLPQAPLQLLLARRKETAYRQHPATSFLNHPFNLWQMLLDRHLARQPHGKHERRRQKRQVADGGPRKRRIENRMLQSAPSDKAIGIERLPHLPRRVHLDVLAHGRQRPAGVDEQQPEMIFPHERRLFADQRGNQAFSLSPEMLKPGENVKFPRLAVIDYQEQMQMVWHDDEIARRQKRPSGMDAAPKGGHGPARRRQFNGVPRLAVALHLRYDARQYRFPPSHAKSEKEETPPALVELQPHASPLLPTSTGGSFPRTPIAAPRHGSAHIAGCFLFRGLAHGCNGFGGLVHGRGGFRGSGRSPDCCLKSAILFANARNDRPQPLSIS